VSEHSAVTCVPASAKPALRREIRAARRSAVTQRDRAADALAIATAVTSALATGTSTVAAYEALPTEPPTGALLTALRARGIRVLVPELLPDNDLDWRALDAEGSPGPLLGPDAIGTAEVIVTPALSVDRHGRRLGQGGGSYDRALARRAPHARVIAVVNDEEYVDGPLPHEPHDARVDAVVTSGLGLLDCPGDAGHR